MREAEGELPKTYRETYVTKYSNGTTTTEHAYRRDKDYRSVYDSGPLHTEDGSLDGVLWRMNGNGQVVVDDLTPSEDDETDPDAPKVVVTRVRTPVDGYLIAQLDAQGRGIKEYVDGATWQTARLEVVLPSGSVVATYDDVRADHGRTFAHHVHTDDGPNHQTSDYSVTEYEPGRVTDAELAIPNPRRRLVELPAGAASVELPTHFANDQIFVRVIINGRGLDFTLDTGSSGITIDSTVARELGLTQFGRRTAFAARRYDTANAVIPEMKVGSIVMHDVAVRIVPHGWEEAPGVKDVGLLGFDFLAELGVTLDYEHRRVTVTSAADFTPPSGAGVTAIEVHIGNGTPRTTVAVNGATGKRFVLDTGGAGSFLITDRFARRHPDAFKSQTPLGGMRIFMGIGGVFAVTPYRMSMVRVAGWGLRDWIGYRIISHAYETTGLDGIIGSEFLRLFTVNLDYGNSRVYLVPNRAGRALITPN
jgi:predicted aspartyl protease